MLRFVTEYRARCTASATVARLTSLRAFYQWCRPLDDPTAGIRVRLPRFEPKRPYSQEELRRLIDACKNAQERALIALLIATGMRRGELCGMRGEDVDWERGLVRVEGKGMKRRWVAPGTKAMAALSVCRNGWGPIWHGRSGQPYTVDGLYQVIRRIGQRAGVDHTYLHRFRTTWANSFLSATHDLEAAQVLMGHSKISQTAQYAAWSRAERALEQARRWAG